MPVLKPRNRLVYFRVSEDEFSQFTALCQSAGARSLSALARTAMQRMLEAPKEELQLSEKLRVFDELTRLLIERLRSINELLPNDDQKMLARKSTSQVALPSLENTNA